MSSRPEVYRRQREKTSSEANIYRFPSKPHPHTMLLVFEEYSFEKGYTSNNGASSEYVTGLLNTGAIGEAGRSSGINVRSRRSVELPFPKQLSDSTDITLNGFGMDPIAEKLASGLASLAGGDSTMGDLAGKLQNAGGDFAKLIGSGMAGGDYSSAMGSIKDTLSSMGVSNTGKAAQYLLQKFSPYVSDDMGKTANQVFGSALNPKETLAFEGVGLRSHQFNWELFPSNAQDSEQINKIVSVMKRSVLPATENFALGSIATFERAFLKYPHICKIYLIGVDERSFTRFKPAMVSNFTVDYAGGGGLSIMKGGKPSGVNISLSLQELSIQTADDYENEMDITEEQRQAGGWVDINGEFMGP